MKKAFSSIILLSALLPALAACGGEDYSLRVSELKSDIFLAETEEFSITLSCVSREHPYLSDGVVAERSDYIEISLVSEIGAQDFSVYAEYGTKVGGDASFRNVRGDYFFSQGVDVFPQSSVNITVTWGEETRELTATSVKNAKTITADEALSYAVKAEKETIDRMTGNAGFTGEFRVRLLRRDKNYYYVGIVSKEGSELSLLLDAESGEVLARREGS